MRVRFEAPVELPIGIYCTAAQAQELAALMPEGLFPAYPPGSVPTLRVLEDSVTGSMSPDKIRVNSWVIEWQENVLAEDKTNHELVNRQIFCAKWYVTLKTQRAGTWKYDSATGDLSYGH